METEKPLACWTGMEEYRGSVLRCLTVIFRTAGCAWNRCRMCGYRHERYPSLPRAVLEKRILAQLAWLGERHPSSSFEMVKIFTSGSFLDPDEVPPSVQDAIVASFRGKLVIAESRPEYVDAARLEELVCRVDDGTWDQPLYVAMGLETTNDYIREKCIDKGHTFADFIDAAGRARKGGAGTKAYLLLKPPFLTESESIADMHHSIREASPYAEILSMNLCTVQKGTEVEQYWRQGAYRPPYLWSVLAVLGQATVHVQCDPVGGGHSRGPHNCGTCDWEIVRGIRQYSLSQDRDLVLALLEEQCGCKEEWEYVLGAEMPYCTPLTR